MSLTALVTFCNTGPTPERQSPATYPHSDCALVNMSTGDVRAVSLGDQGASGMTYLESGETIIAVQAGGSLVRLSPQLGIVNRYHDDALSDTHSLAAMASSLFAVSTGRECILEYHVGRHQLELRTAHHMTEGSVDTLHVNSVCLHQGRVLVTMFGEGWRNQPHSAETGSIVDLHSRQTLSAAIRHPHSLFSTESALYVLGSSHGTVEEVLSSGERVVRATYPGYLRGLTIFDGGALVGVSRRRNRSSASHRGGDRRPPYEAHCGVLRFNQRWELMDFVDLSWVGPEIFDVALAPSGLVEPNTGDTLEAAKQRIAHFEALWTTRSVAEGVHFAPGRGPTREPTPKPGKSEIRRY